jgi:hypothetical protein
LLRSRGHQPVFFTPEENAARRRGLSADWLEFPAWTSSKKSTRAA